MFVDDGMMVKLFLYVGLILGMIIMYAIHIIIEIIVSAICMKREQEFLDSLSDREYRKYMDRFVRRD